MSRDWAFTYRRGTQEYSALISLFFCSSAVTRFLLLMKALLYLDCIYSLLFFISIIVISRGRDRRSRSIFTPRFQHLAPFVLVVSHVYGCFSILVLFITWMYIKIELICSTTSRRVCMLKGSRKTCLILHTTKKYTKCMSKNGKPKQKNDELRCWVLLERTTKKRRKRQQV